MIIQHAVHNIVSVLVGVQIKILPVVSFLFDNY